MGTSTHIRRTGVSKRNPVYDDQARFFAILVREMIDEYNAVTELQGGGPLELSDFFDIAAYLRFVQGAAACGFVCTDLKPDFPIDDVLRNPAQSLGVLNFKQLRHYAHTLLRAEKWAEGHESPIRRALDAGGMVILCDRLLHDASLRD